MASRPAHNVDVCHDVKSHNCSRWTNVDSAAAAATSTPLFFLVLEIALFVSVCLHVHALLLLLLLMLMLLFPRMVSINYYRYQPPTLWINDEDQCFLYSHYCQKCHWITLPIESVLLDAFYCSLYFCSTLFCARRMHDVLCCTNLDAKCGLPTRIWF